MRAASMRQLTETLGTNFPPPGDAISEGVLINGLPAEWVATPQTDQIRAILYLPGAGCCLQVTNRQRWPCLEILRRWPRRRLPGATTRVRTAVARVQCVYLTVGRSGRHRREHDRKGSRRLDGWKRGARLVRRYVSTGAIVRALLASPIYADLQGLPQMLIHVGSAETLLDDANRLAQITAGAGADVQLKIWDKMVHIWDLFASILDEGAQATVEAGAFVKLHLHV